MLSAAGSPLSTLGAHCQLTNCMDFLPPGQTDYSNHPEDKVRQMAWLTPLLETRRQVLDQFLQVDTGQGHTTVWDHHCYNNLVIMRRDGTAQLHRRAPQSPLLWCAGLHVFLLISLQLF